jgi:hypothetical protein
MTKEIRIPNSELPLGTHFHFSDVVNRHSFPGAPGLGTAFAIRHSCFVNL